MRRHPLLLSLAPLALLLGPLTAVASARPTSHGLDWQLSAKKHTRLGTLRISLGNHGLRGSLHAPRYPLPRGPRVHHHTAACGVIPGHYETRYEQVWVPGRSESVWVPAEVQVYTDAYGYRTERVIRPGHWETIQHPGHYEQRAVQVWVEARYRCGAGGITPYR